MQKFIYAALALVVLVIVSRAIYNGPPKTECLQMLDGDCIKLRIVPKKSDDTDAAQPRG
jgi:hypothetical protein